MKRYPIHITLIICLGLFFSACNSDDDFPSQGTLEQTMKAALSLIDTTEEGLEVGDYPPGAHDRLQTQVDWCQYIINSCEDDKALVNANKKLNEEIEYFKGNVVKAGFPLYTEGSYFNLGKLSAYNIYDQFTLECKVRFHDFGSTLGNIFTAEDGSGGIILRNNGNIVDAYVGDGGWLGGGASIGLELDKWHHLAFTFSGTEVILYIDGKVALTATGGKRSVKAGENLNLHVGTHPSYNNRFMNGNVAYVSIWDHPRTQAQIQADMNPSFTGTEQGLLAYWPFDVNLGSSIVDVTGNWTAQGNLVSWEDE